MVCFLFAVDACLFTSTFQDLADGSCFSQRPITEPDLVVGSPVVFYGQVKWAVVVHHRLRPKLNKSFVAFHRTARSIFLIRKNIFFDPFGAKERLAEVVPPLLAFVKRRGIPEILHLYHPASG